MNLTDEEIRIKVAEAMGARLWNNPTQSGPSQLWGFQAPSPGEVFARMWLCGEADCLLPNYPESLDACTEFEKTLTYEEAEVYEDELCDICKRDNDLEDNPAPWRFAVATAKPKQRCLAYLRVKGTPP